MRCVECETESSGRAEGWRAYVGGEDHEIEVVIFCPDCARREFGSAADLPLSDEDSNF